jgi:hypothetical protein
MKTAILKTTIWDDDDFYELNIDTKLLYLLLMSSPERGVSDIYKVSDRILSARSGLSSDQLKICKKQLHEKGLVSFNGKYIKLSQSAYVLPKKGRFTEQALNNEYSEVPQSVIEAFSSNSSLIVEYYNDTIYNNKDNNKNKDIYKDNNKVSTKTIDAMFEYWHKIVGYEITAKKPQNRQYCGKLIKDYSKEDIAKMIQASALASEDKYAPRVSNFIDLYRKFDDLKLWVKRETKTNIPSVVVI